MHLGFFMLLVVVAIIMAACSLAVIIEEGKLRFLWGMLPAVGMLTWAYFISQADAEYKYLDEHVIVHKVDSVDIVVLNGDDIINLNSRFNRSFEDGEKIMLKQPKERSYYGVYFDDDDFYLVDKNEVKVK